MPLRIHNTLTNAVEPVAPADPSRVTFYTCGPTVYDDAHIGNFRSFLAADLLRRWLESPLCELTAPDGSVHAGPRQVVHVMNITDVGHMTDDDDADGAGEDKMVAAEKRLRDAKKAGTLHVDVDIDPSDQTAIARFYADRFLDDARRLGLKVAIEEQADPSLMPRASDNVPGMIEMIESLIEKDHAYAVGEPGSQTVYFDVRSFASYGRLSGNTIEDVRSGAGGRVTDDQTAQKKHPADFLLWKADPSHKMKWPSPWGEGYPGWHIECSVMALARLDPDSTGIIDLHSGGEDNIFPHHECELAQSCSATGADRFARHWFHPRFLIVEGQKMSKSKGNFFTARELFDKGHEPAAVRLELIKTHYRTNANFTEQGLKDSARMIERWRKARMDIARCSMGWKDAGIEVRKAGSLVNNGFAATLNDDLNIAGAIGHINTRVNALLEVCASTGLKSQISDSEIENLWQETSVDYSLNVPFDLFYHIEPLLGVLSLERQPEQETSIGIFKGLDPDPAVIDLLEMRRDARADKDFARADSIRDRLAEMGYAIKDAPGGRVEVSRG